MNKQSGVWNRAGRRSGGSKPLRIVGVPKDGPVPPALSVQCYERRCVECFGTMEPWAPGKCECPCHQTQGNP